MKDHTEDGDQEIWEEHWNTYQEEQKTFVNTLPIIDCSWKSIYGMIMGETPT